MPGCNNGRLACRPIFPAQSRDVKGEIAGIFIINNGLNFVLGEVQSLGQDAGQEDIEKAVHMSLEVRIKVADRMVQPGGEFQRYFGVAGGGDDERHLFRRGKRGCLRSAAAQLKTRGPPGRSAANGGLLVGSGHGTEETCQRAPPVGCETGLVKG